MLISYKIWQVQQEVDRYSPTAMRPSGSRVILAIIESGESAVDEQGHRNVTHTPYSRDIFRSSSDTYHHKRGRHTGDARNARPGESRRITPPGFPDTGFTQIAPCVGIIFSMVIVCVSVDRTRWDSIKISTHLNFVSGFNTSTNSVNQQGSSGNEIVDDKVKVEHHVQTPVFTYSRGGSAVSLSDFV